MSSLTHREYAVDDTAWSKSTVWQLITASAKPRPQAEALVARDDSGAVTRVTYGELVEKVEALSDGLAGIGVVRGDRLALIMTNRMEWLYTYFAGMRLGATIVPINTRLNTKDIEYILTKSRANHVVAMDTFRRISITAMIDQICPEWKNVRAGNPISASLPDLRNVIMWSRSGTYDRDHSYAFPDLMSASDPDSKGRAESIAATVTPDDAAVIKFTSGSTGKPKGAVLQQWGIVTNSVLHSTRLGIRDDDVCFCPMPFYHVGGSIWGLMTMLAQGGKLVFPEAWDPGAAIALIKAERCTFQMAVGPMVRDELQVAGEGGQLPTLRIAHRGNAALEGSAAKLFRNAFLFHPYGLTEGYGPIALISPDDPPDKHSTQGRLLDGVECKIVNRATGEILPPGEVGELWIKGLVMRGYFGDPEQTAAAIDNAGWLHTQDLAKLDEDGYLTYVGRIKAMIKVGGENVAAEEVEAAVRAFAQVEDCCAVSVHDERTQEAIRIYVIPRDPQAPFDIGALRQWCTAELSRFKVPRDYCIVSSLPMTDTGKIDRGAVSAGRANDRIIIQEVRNGG